MNRTPHWIKKDWPQRTSLSSGSKNIVRQALVDPPKILLCPFHTKLGMKQFMKALPKEFKYLSDKLKHLSDVKIKEGFFVVPYIRELMLNADFAKTMNKTAELAWKSLKEVIF